MRLGTRSVLAARNICTAVLVAVVPIAPVIPGGDVAFGQSGTGSPAGNRLFTAIDLNPNGFVESWASGISGGQQVGDGSGPATGGQVHALLWSGGAASVVDLHPNGFLRSRALGASGGEQVGYGEPANWYRHALLWRGSAASMVDLHPSGFKDSGAVGTSGGQQVGWGYPSRPSWEHALLWHGSAGSGMDLDPSGFLSQAVGISGEEQVGYGGQANGNHALLWHDGAGSPVDLHPKGFTQSYALGISGGQQVGYGSLDRYPQFRQDSGPFRALLWRGNAASVVDLHPSRLADSKALGTSGGQQVGWGAGASTGNAHHALLWCGTAERMVDLNAFLPPGFVGSIASGIDSTGDIVGVAWGPASDNRNHAFLWRRNVPHLATIPLCHGESIRVLGVDFSVAEPDAPTRDTIS